MEVFEESLSGSMLLGQVIVPLQWLLPLTLAPYSPRRFRIEPTWLEVFPPMPPTLFNNGGKYRPFMKGLPYSTGYGLIAGEKAVGFLYAELELELMDSLVTTLLRDPWRYAAADDSVAVPEVGDYNVCCVYTYIYTVCMYDQSSDYQNIILIYLYFLHNVG
jgi:hypothetical protein